MFGRKRLLSSAGRSVVVAVAAGLVITMTEPPMASAGSSVPVTKGVSAAMPSGGATDFSARRRHYRHYRGGNAAGLAIMGAMIGTMGAAIAAQQWRDDRYYYGYGPGYYGPPVYYGPPAYYGYGPYYGRRYYRYYPY